MTATATEPTVIYRDELAIGSLAVREDSDTGLREVSGIGVPYGKDAHIRGWLADYIERFEKGAVQDSDDALLYWRHGEPIGRVTAARNTDAGWEITATISKTPRGDEAYQLVRDGVIREFSIGFIPIDHREEVEDETKVIVRTKVKVREVSLVPFGAYGKDAPVSQVREDTNPNPKEPPMTADTITRADLTEVHQSIEDLKRAVDLIPSSASEPEVDTRSAGEVLKAIAGGDDETIREYEALLERAYTGGTSADAIVKPGWVGDLTRIFDASTGVLADVFSAGGLPEHGNTIEYAELESNTIDVQKQAAEGDNITFGKVKITTKTAPVATYAGGTELTRQSIDRASISVLNTSLEALATAAGARKKAALRALYVATIAARKAVADDAGVVALGATLAAGTASHWEDVLVDAALKFETLNLSMEAMLVSASVFKKMRSLTVAGERVFQTHKDNASGVLNLPGLSGEFAGLPVRLDSGQAGDEAVFANGRALRQYDSAVMSLTDENLVNLSKSFAVYRYGAVAAEIPAGIVPVKFGA